MVPFNDDNGGPAFPISIPGCGDNGAGGMTLRDYFAAKAMQAAITTSGAPWMSRDQACANAVADMAYQVADAMLRARSRT